MKISNHYEPGAKATPERNETQAVGAALGSSDHNNLIADEYAIPGSIEQSPDSRGATLTATLAHFGYRLHRTALGVYIQRANNAKGATSRLYKQKLGRKASAA